jgi:3-hydroxyacyl-CoA dehydrogenase
MKTIQKVVILGAGVKRSCLAGVQASVAMRCDMLYLVPPREPNESETARGLTRESKAFRNKFSLAALERIKNQRNGIIYSQENVSLISIGNMEDDIDKIKEADWIIEVVLENLEVKQQVMDLVIPRRRPGAIVSTNTSGVSIKGIAEKMPPECKQHFLGTHFFNPPRFMRLFEIIPLPETLPDVVSAVEKMARDVLGKGVVYAKDTPNFIGNRIASASSAEMLRLMLRYGFDLPVIDQLAGPVMGRSKNGIFKTADLVGLDIFANVSGNVVDTISDPAEKDIFRQPSFVADLIKAGALGNKAKHGFYRKLPTGERQFWDYKAREYKTYDAKMVVPAVDEAMKAANKFEAMVYGDLPENQCVWEHTKMLLLYSASKVPEIADDFKMIDKAMNWGYNWEKGPFAIWDAIGPERSIERMKKEGAVIPAWVEEYLAKNGGRFYGEQAAETPYVRLDQKEAGAVAGNEDATLHDIGDGVLCLEFHAKGNSISDKTMQMIKQAREELERDAWEALVIGNRGKNFSAGANLTGIYRLSSEKQWDAIAKHVRGLQSAYMNLKYAPKPVLAAPFAMTIGGGCECVLHTSRAVPMAETYMGLVESGVGLIPGGGGCKEMLVRAIERAGGAGAKRGAILGAVREAWQNIATGAVSQNAFDAISKGYLRKGTQIFFNPDGQIDEAKAAALEMARARYMPPLPPALVLLGSYGLAAIRNIIEGMCQGGYMSAYDKHIALKSAYVMTGGDVAPGAIADEQYVLDLECEAFVSLCGEENTQARIAHMLKTGKPLRN